MPKKKQETEKKHLLPIPDKGSPDYFRVVVKNCITAYEKLPNNSMALDYCKIADKRLRAMILDDEEYKTETRNIYARQRLQEIEEIEYLASLSSNEEEDDDEGEAEFVHPSERGNKPAKKTKTADKDMINMRFKAVQMKRDMFADLANAVGDVEQNAINFMEIPITVQEFDRLLTVEMSEGTDEADIDSLIGTKEDIPGGTATLDGDIDSADSDSLFEVLPGGEIREKD
jgi:hypothetical protein